VDNQELYNEIIIWTVFSTHTTDINKQALNLWESLEFYHDKGGLTTSKQEILMQQNKISVAK
jgi:hypothetical protein